MATQPKMDLKYEAEDDARTLARAEEIRSKPALLRRAVTMARKQAKDVEEQARTLRKVSRSKFSKRR